MFLDFSDDVLVRDFGVSRESLDVLRAYEVQLHKWQNAINIVSNKSLQESWERHFVDSIQLLPYLPLKIDARYKIADLGSGGGFPGLVLAILRDDLDVHLIDSDQRKCQFLKNVSRETSTFVSVHSGRVEAVLKDVGPDIITARGFAPLVSLFNYVEDVISANPALKFLLLKGRSALDEVEAAREYYSFDCLSHPSITQTESHVLQISNVRKLP